MKLYLYEILVPAQIESSRTCPGGKYNPKGWDEFVSNLVGGLTIVKKTTGLWVHPTTQEEIKEKMVLVRIACTEIQLKEILKFTKQYYSQEIVMAYEISNNVYLE